ncbi:lasso RiPP family leader peptide-containing protein [Nocardiopsis sp. RSe5-2]|uniref:Lasso RiPP family leader peptide-containing protein n=1 Tax=Nocardiopsis endophytica TaxID=3018445 RepID=A0ABT4TZL9_9ACTN|nr:lasso RiPP family leader peptide-containing protein [Nocardiopsis endophytica]MDA2809547.1 lasso RiPP family leader peptide-containing protein [Nocardiopsis endophytica]
MEPETAGSAELPHAYEPPMVVDMGSVPESTLGKFAEDTKDQNRYFD